MKLTRILAPILCVLAAVTGAMAQTQITPAVSTRASNLSFVAGRFVANEYSNYGGPFAAEISSGNAATGSSTITVRGGYIVLQDGRAVVPFAVGVPIVINDSTPELVTPTAVSGCYKSQGLNQDGILVTCSITASFTYTHGVGASISSGTGGIAEAVLDAVNWGGGVVTIEPGYFLNTSCTNCYASKAAAIAAVLAYPNVNIEDASSALGVFYTARPTANTAISAITAPTFTFATGANSYYCSEAYVDIYGQFSAWVEESSQSTSAAFPATASVPAAATGAVGVAVACTANGGSSKAETIYNLTSSNCTLTKLETVIPACAVTNATYNQTATASISLAAAPPTTTAKTNGIATGDTANNTRTTAAYQPTSAAVAGLMFPNVLASLTASSSGNIGTYELAAFNLPAGILNVAGKKYQVCIDWEATPANTATVTFNLYYGPYNNSDTKILAIPSGTFSGSGAHTQSQVCGNLTTVTTGATGSILTSGFSLAALASSNVGTLELQDNSTSSPIFTSLPLSTQQQVRLEAVVGTANLGTAITIDGFSVIPID